MNIDCRIDIVYFSRSKYYHFEEFLGQWLEKLKAADKTSMTVKLMKDIDRYRVSTLQVLSVVSAMHRCHS